MDNGIAEVIQASALRAMALSETTKATPVALPLLVSELTAPLRHDPLDGIDDCLPYVQAGAPSPATLCYQLHQINDIPAYLDKIDEAEGINALDPEDELEDLAFLRHVYQPFILRLKVKSPWHTVIAYLTPQLRPILEVLQDHLLQTVDYLRTVKDENDSTVEWLHIHRHDQKPALYPAESVLSTGGLYAMLALLARHAKRTTPASFLRDRYRQLQCWLHGSVQTVTIQQQKYRGFVDAVAFQLTWGDATTASGPSKEQMRWIAHKGFWMEVTRPDFGTAVAGSLPVNVALQPEEKDEQQDVAQRAKITQLKNEKEVQHAKRLVETQQAKEILQQWMARLLKEKPEDVFAFTKQYALDHLP